MSWLKNNFKILLPLFLIFCNFWIIRIFTLNTFVGVVVSICSLSMILGKQRKLILTLGILILFLTQVFTTNKTNLTYLDNDGQRVQQERIRSYPVVPINLYFRTVWLIPSKWIEQNKFIIGASKIEENIFEALDLNYYFFGGFPRNNPSDYEKSPFIYLPFFIAGVFLFISKRGYLILTLTFLIPLILTAFIGTDNPYGLFTFFPFLTLCLLEGLEFFSRFFDKKIFFACLVLLSLLTLFMQINYATK